MKILVLAFYYPPDLSAGAFRCAALMEQLSQALPKNAEIHLMTTRPNRFSTYEVEAPLKEQQHNLKIMRFPVPQIKDGAKNQVKIFLHYISKLYPNIKHEKYDLVFATSSKLFTAMLGSAIARWKRCPLYLDIRDIFVDTISDTLPQKAGFVLVPFFSMVERWTIRRAQCVNLVSPGFADYFTSRYPKTRFSFYTNGVDQVTPPSKQSDPPRKILQVLYAGTMGEGQGLDIILPELAHKTAGHLHFRVIGGGARKEKLATRLKQLGCDNVELVLPMSREALQEAYLEADILFLHLNDFKAFHKVLPSKIFEYAATGKPIWAGIGGFAARFVTEEIDNAVVFKPGDAREAMRVFKNLKHGFVPRTQFIEKFSRSRIMADMTNDILSLANGSG